MKKHLSFLTVICICFILATSVLANMPGEKDSGNTIEPVFSFDGYEVMPEELVEQAGLEYSSLYYMKYLFGNGIESVYIVANDTEKVGWFLLDGNRNMRPYDSVTDSTLFLSQNPEDKISTELKEQMNSSDELSVYIWLKDIDLQKEYVNYSDNRTAEEVWQQVLGRRHTAEEAYEYYNRSFIESFFPKYSDSIDTYKNIKEYKQSGPECYISLYAPFIIMNLTNAEITRASEIEAVEEIGWLKQVEAYNEINSASQAIQGNYVRDVQGYTGSGAVIGLLDVDGVPDTSYSELTGADITIKSGDTVVASHATVTATSIIGQTVGLAPDCKLYASKMHGGSYFFADVEWLLSKGVYAINCSFGLGSSGTYDVYSQWVDHVDMNHDVLVIKSAGNTGGNITSPGMSYNAVTVGGFNDNNTGTNHADDTMYTNSAWIESSGLAEKPDLIAPAVSISFPSIAASNGTSYAAPLTTGTIAQIISARPGLADQPGQLKSILLASAFRKISSSNYGSITYAPYISDKEGAGKLDAKNAIYVAINNRYAYSYVPVNNFPFTTSFYADASETQMRVALCWLKQNVINSGSHTQYPNDSLFIRGWSDLDLELYDPNGTRIEYSMSENGNIEIIDFDPQSTGYYTIKVKKVSTGANVTQEFIYLAWW